MVPEMSKNMWFPVTKIKMSLVLNFEQPLSICGSGVFYFLGAQPLDLGDGFGHAVDIAGVAPLAAVGRGGHVGGICFDHDAVQGHGGDDLRGFAGVFEGDGAGERERRGLAGNYFQRRGASRIGVSFPAMRRRMRQLEPQI